MTVCNVNITEEVKVFQMVTAVPTFVLGFLVNTTVLILFCRQWRNCNDMMVYLANVALADTTALVSLPFRMYSYNNTWSFSVSSCQVLVSTFFVNMYISIFTTVAISVVRFVVIKYPFKASMVMSPWKALGVCMGIWLVVGSLSAKFHSVDVQEVNTSSLRCFQKNSERPLPLSFILTLDIIGFLLPFVIMMYCSANVIYTLSMRIKSSRSSQGKSLSVRIIAANLVVFVVCFSPLHFGYLLKFLCETYWPDNCKWQQFAHSFVHVATCIASMNCFLDCFSYYFLATSSWGTLREAFSGTQRRKRQNSHLTQGRGYSSAYNLNSAPLEKM